MSHLYMYTGPNSHPYYNNGQRYDIKMYRTWPLRRIAIYMPQGRRASIEGSWIKYKNFEAFKRDWKKL